MPNTPSPLLDRGILAGHFREYKIYSAHRQHGTSDWLIVYTVKGLGRFGYQTGEIIVKPGDITLLRPGTHHDYGLEHTLKHWELLWAHFMPRPTWLDWLKWPEIAPGLMRLSIADPALRKKIATRMSEMRRLFSGHLKRREIFAMNALEEVLLWCDETLPRPRQTPLDPRIRKALDKLCQDLTQPLSLRELGKQCGLSLSRLSHLFQEQVGQSPRHFHEFQRIQQARQLLELTQRSVSEIAYETGFNNPFYFSLRFKKQTGKSPRVYRKALGGNPR